MQCLLYIIWPWQNRHYHSEAPLTANSYWILFYSDIGVCVHFPCCLAVMLHCQRIARTKPLLIDVARLKTQEKNSKNWRAIGWLFARYEMVQKRKVSIPRWETSPSPTWEWFHCYCLCSWRHCVRSKVHGQLFGNQTWPSFYGRVEVSQMASSERKHLNTGRLLPSTHSGYIKLDAWLGLVKRVRHIRRRIPGIAQRRLSKGGCFSV